jgi:NAD(P)-dependent dehydrogenase (short-subunit alcohol dehydrogenase family)
MKLKNAVVFITGANRGPGRAFAEAALAAGAAKVYAAARDIVGFMDTDMTRGLDAPKAAPADVARLALEGVEAGAFEVLADDISRHVKQSLSTPTPAYAG